MTEVRFESPRYELINSLGAGAMGTVHRVLDRLSGQVLTLKRVQVDSDALEWGKGSASDTTALKIAFAREFRLLASLRHPHIISVVNFGWDQDDVPFFTMDLQENAQTILEAAHGQATTVQVAMLTQLLQALNYLHTQSIVHRDLKPDNVIVNRGQVKVLDFGIALRRTDEETAAEYSGGTLSYSAPELLRGAQASVASDLWAVGVIAFEIFHGEHPFPQKKRGALFRAIFNDEPSFVDEYEGRLSAVVSRLLAKEPTERFQNAQAVIAALSEAIGHPLVDETIETRESFLRRSRMVGRGRELERMSAFVDRAAQKKGATVLVGGVSGIGKSRLLDELALIAIAQGALVLKGQTRAEASTPYGVWRDAIRAMVLEAQVTELEAGILMAVAPDIASLTGRPVAPAPPLDAEASHVRLLKTIEALFRRQRRPVVVLLEDIHWASSESIGLISWMSAVAQELPLLIVGSFRNDERQDLLEEVPGAEEVSLAPLTHSEIEELIEAMLGASNERQELIGLLKRETEGNPFFLVEIVRALAENAGGLDAIGTKPFPEGLLAGGIRRLVRQRIDAVAAVDRPVLELAAVAGRRVDRSLLTKILPEIELDGWLNRCAEQAMLSPYQDGWQFAHDKFREGLLEELDAERLAHLHRQIGEALEARDDQAAMATRLAYHFAGCADRAKEGQYSEVAGSGALRSGAYVECIRYSKRALELGAGDADSVKLAQIERRLGEASFRMGLLPEARTHLAASLCSLGYPVPSTQGAMVLGILAQSWRQMRHRRAPDKFIGRERAHHVKLAEAVLAHTELSRLAHHQNDDPLLLFVTLRALNMAEAADLPMQRARLSSVMGTVLGLIPAHSWARGYFERARALAKGGEDEQPMALVFAHQAYYEAGIGEWEQAEEHLLESMRIYENVGDQRLWEENVSILGYTCFYRGQLQRARSLFEKLAESGLRRKDNQVASWGLTNKTRMGALLGQLREAEEQLKGASALIIDGITKSVLMGAEVLLELLRKDVSRAAEKAVEAADALKKSPPRSFMSCAAYARVAEALLQKWEIDKDPALLKQAKASIKTLKSLVRLFPFAAPYAHQAVGLLCAGEGRPEAAAEALKRAAESAKTHNMPLEEARAYALLARHGPESDRALNREKAAEIYRTAEVPWWPGEEDGDDRAT